MEPIAGEVTRELRRLGPAGDITAIAAAWPEAVGDAIARHAWPARIARDRTMHVATDSSAWAFELSQLAPVLVERLRDAVGETAPTVLQFAVGPLPEVSKPAPDEEASRAPEPTAEQLALASAIAAGVDDEHLRELIARAAAASLARTASDR